MTQRDSSFYHKLFSAAYNACTGSHSCIGNSELTKSFISALFDGMDLPPLSLNYTVDYLLRQALLYHSDNYQIFVQMDPYYLCSNFQVSPDEIVMRDPFQCVDRAWLGDVLWEYTQKVFLDTFEQFLKLFRIFRFDPSPSSLLYLESFLFLLVLSDQHVPYLKYKVCWYENYSQRNEESQFPKRNEVFDFIQFGSPKFHSEILRTRRKPFWINTIFQGFKRGILPVSPVRVFKQAAEHKKALSKVHNTPDSLLTDIDSIVDELCLPFLRNRDTLFEEGTVSINGSNSHSRSEGGVMSATLQLLEDEDYLPLDHSLSFGIEIFESSRYPFFQMTTVTMTLDTDVYTAWESYLKDHPEMDVCEAIPAQILEPFKVRTVTLGDPLSNAFLNVVQKWLYNSMQSFDLGPVNPFILTNENSRHLVQFNCQLLSFFSSNLKGKWVSVDYSAATDKLSVHASHRILSRLFHNLRINFPEEFADLEWRFKQSLSSLCSYNMNTSSSVVAHDEVFCRAWNEIYCLTGCQCRDYMPSWSIDWEQKNGQLMGSIISFPILCLANLITYVRTIREVHGNIPLDELLETYPVLINGDDMLFKASCPQVVESFYKNTSLIGFEPSLGKNFVNDEYFTVNSKLFRCDEFGYLEYVPFVNFGLLQGRKKGSKDDIPYKGYLSERVDALRDNFLQLQEKITSKKLLDSLTSEYLSFARKLIPDWVSNATKQTGLELHLLENDVSFKKELKALNGIDRNPYSRVIGSASTSARSRAGFLLKGIRPRLRANYRYVTEAETICSRDSEDISEPWEQWGLQSGGPLYPLVSRRFVRRRRPYGKRLVYRTQGALSRRERLGGFTGAFSTPLRASFALNSLISTLIAREGLEMELEPFALKCGPVGDLPVLKSRNRSRFVLLETGDTTSHLVDSSLFGESMDS